MFQISNIILYYKKINNTRGGGHFWFKKEASKLRISGIFSFHFCMPFTSKHLMTKKLHRDFKRERKNVGMFVFVIHNIVQSNHDDLPRLFLLLSFVFLLLHSPQFLNSSLLPTKAKG
jgi:hypothetical protein